MWLESNRGCIADAHPGIAPNLAMLFLQRFSISSHPTQRPSGAKSLSAPPAGPARIGCDHVIRNIPDFAPA
jgi:hypothetical protein